MKRYLSLLISCIVFAATVPCLAGGALAAGTSPAAGAVEQMQDQMLADPQIMTLIGTLQNDPQMKALLADPKVLDAVLSGDYGVLLGDPRFRAILDGRQVKEIGQKLENRNVGTGAR